MSHVVQKVELFPVGSLNIVNKVVVKLTKQPSLAKVLALKFPIVC
jgi:hypothetical protein